MTDAEARAKAINLLANEFRGDVLEHIHDRRVVLTKRAHNGNGSMHYRIPHPVSAVDLFAPFESNPLRYGGNSWFGQYTDVLLEAKPYLYGPELLKVWVYE